MDKPNIFKSSSFYMEAGDILHIIIKGESGSPTLIHLMGGESGDIPEDASGVGLLDYDGNEYTEITIGNQKWIVENFRSTHYADGTAIPNIPLLADWAADIAGAYCWYDNDAVTNIDYGLLYNWYAVNNEHGLAYLTRDGIQESGWRVPTKEDMEELETYLGGHGMWYLIGNKLKESGTEHWSVGNTGSDDYEFRALPGGLRSEGPLDFEYLNDYAFFWTATSFADNFKYRLRLIYSYGLFEIDYTSKGTGQAVRLVKPMAESVIVITTTINGYFTVTLDGAGAISINWGDGNVSNEVLTGSTDYSHSYTAGGTITITGIENITSITSIYAEITDCVIPSTAINLTYINFNNNNLTTFETHAEWTALEELYLIDNNLTSLTTYAEWVTLTDFAISGNSALGSIILHEEWVNIERIICDSCGLTAVTTYDTWVNINYVGFSGNAFTSFIAHDTWILLANLYLDACGLTAFTTHDTWIALERLDVSNNSLTTLTTYDTWVALIELNLVGNDLTAIVTHPEWMVLEILNVGDNELTTLETHPEWTALQNLYCSGNNLSTLVAYHEWAVFYVLHAYDNAITDADDINNILIELDAIGMTEGGILLNFGTNAAPTGAGITAKNSLIASGVIVETN